ncbi:MAG: hypothetical protein FWF83_01395 [Clostridiales bacterium]|nr:hypothetical protein [Clostridiales bacterium]
MTPEKQKIHDEKAQRIKDAIALKEPDRVPVMPHPGIYPIFNAGYTMAEVVYDTSLEKAKHATIKYLTDFNPDAGTGLGTNNAGEGPAMELSKARSMRWAGMPGNIVDENSYQQFIEFPLLLDDEFEEFFTDRTGWALRKALPRNNEIFDPLTNFSYGIGGMGVRRMASLISTPEYRAMIEDLWKIDAFYKELQVKERAATKEIEELGFPMLRGGGGGGVPFDFYSDFLRGTILSLTDLYDRPEDVQRYIDESIEITLANIKATKGMDEGKHVFMALHKAMDGWMNDEYYRRYYWDHLQKIILAIVDAGRIPYVYTEGKYNTRLDCLTEVPPGKVFYHFEDVDMAVAKKKLGGIACISGGFPAAILDWGTTTMVREEVKKIFDACAPGGGFIFETSCGMGNCKRENVEAMFDEAFKLGKY